MVDSYDKDVSTFNHVQQLTNPKLSSAHTVAKYKTQKLKK